MAAIKFKALLADKAVDADWQVEILKDQAVQVVISQKSKRRRPLAIDLEVYQWRHLIENFLGKLKEFKRIAMRNNKTDSSFAAVIYLAAAVINSR
jgi:transposase